jgi:uncharacterized membrane protein YhaH (DUF805 family)
MQEAVRTVLAKNYSNFHGRARRSEYWWWFLAVVILYIVLGILRALIGSGFLVVELIVGLALFVPNIAVGARRLHDTGKSGWLQLIGIIPLIGAIVLIVLFAKEGDAGSNAHGPSPKGVTA